MDPVTVATFIFYLVGMFTIGIIFYKLTHNLSDYVLGGRRLGGGVAALSAGASDMSSWLILALPGAMFIGGMSEIWLPIGLAAGAYLNWQFMARRLRRYTAYANDSITIPDFLENRFRDRTKLLRMISAVFILLFFAFYTSSGLVGGATLFQGSFGWEYTTALWVGAAVIIVYTFLGGFLAVSWTDFFQGILMFLALIVVPIRAMMEMGGWNETVQAVGEVDPAHLDVFTGASAIGIISLLAWGLGYFGQPHIITRFMAIKSEDEVPKARLIGMTWMVLSLFGAIFTGFVGIAYFTGAGPGNPIAEGDHETVFILFTQVLFDPWIAGFLLAAILAAIMSTIDSQLLVSSSALAEDFYKGFLRPHATGTELMWVGRIGVLVIALIATFLAYNPDSTVLELVQYAWAGFGAVFGPVILLSLFWRRMTMPGALFGMIAGGLTVILWALPEGGIFDLYELVPGFIMGGLIAIVASLLSRPPSDEVIAEFERVERREG
ncbi:sodium/proline symporter [Salsuginibacillus halophilus]|uniref:Sodium/proline symporter n=1 Tax=Salsuginibacillus halophilus TaxID=517424 RepID=A0A2P8HFU8_9BACI|nr:sodium/proline symporter PutP [Salsuginibacillus halophilus]PSL45086.1 sodium/proline symporter [Salsuginibacillus halophilus]